MRYLLTATVLLTSLGCAHLSDPCDNRPLARVPSPDGTLVLATYHRECRSTVLTVAAVEKPAGASGTPGEVVCYLMSWSDRHPLDAKWKGSDAIAIATTDRLEKADVQDSKDSCAGVRVSYAVQFRNEQQTTNDPEVLSRLKKALADLGPCVRSFYKAASTSNDPVEHMTRIIENGEHRSALELLLGYAGDAGCPVAPSTYDALKSLSVAFDLKEGYLARISARH